MWNDFKKDVRQGSQNAESVFGWIAVAGTIIIMPFVLAYMSVIFLVGVFKDEEKTKLKENIKETQTLLQEVEALYAKTHLDDEDAKTIQHSVVERAVDAFGDAPQEDILFSYLQMVKELGFGEGINVQINWTPDMEMELVDWTDLRNILRAQKRFFSNYEDNMDYWGAVVAVVLKDIMELLPDSAFDDEPEEATTQTLEASFVDLMEDPADAIEDTILTFHGAEINRRKFFKDLQVSLDRRLKIASGMEPGDPWNGKAGRQPTEMKNVSPSDLVDIYLGGTPLAQLFEAKVKFGLPFETRFEHTHIIGGTGHGKTQLMQMLLQHDLEQAREGRGSVVVIDGHGDFIKTVRSLKMFSKGAERSLSDKIVVIDADDVDFPVCLNMFDINADELVEYSSRDREQIINGTIELYEYFFGALLGADLTQKQSVVFRYLARLMLNIPDATVHTLLDVMQNGEQFRPYMEQLDPMSRRFFETQFFNKSFDDTKEQIARRLWGILGNQTFERMFNNKRNKVNIAKAMNDGKIILINTAKDLLGTDGSAIFGRFFIAMILQGALKRSVIDPKYRRSTFVYVDEAHDYFDDKLEDILNQTRKYRVGLTLAHQNLDELSPKQRATLLASTSIKFAGGVSGKDARAMADDMRCNSDFILDATRREKIGETEFACFIKNSLRKAIKVRVPLGSMEKLPRMDASELAEMIAQNRQRYARAGGTENPTSNAPDMSGEQSNKKPPAETNGEFTLGDPKPL